MFALRLIHLSFMKKISLTSLLFLLIMTCWAQHSLIFSNKSTKKEILIQSGDLVKFSYKGYLGQTEIKSGIVMGVQDSVVEITGPVSGRLSLGATETRFILIKDITGFRKFHRSKPFLTALSNIAITAGSIYMFYTIDKKTNLSFGEKFGLSVGTGLLTTFIVRAMFPERIKYRIGTDWMITVMK
jgi:hypothetical protein